MITLIFTVSTSIVVGVIIGILVTLSFMEKANGS